MAAIAIQNSGLSGLKPIYSAATAGGDTFFNDGNTVLHVKNADATSKTVTINSVTQCSFGFDHDVVVAVPAGEERVIGPFSTSRFGANPEVTYSAVTSVTVAAVHSK